MNYKNKEILNLQQQVQQNKEDIARHYEIDRSLANFGIKIVGTVGSTSLLPGQNAQYPFPMAPDYTGTYGDAYAVGSNGDYTYYIYTRPDLNQGYGRSYWLNVGKLVIKGDKGDRGEQGPQGLRGQSAHWYTGIRTSLNNIVPNEGDFYLVTDGNATGNLYQYINSQWSYVTNIQGPQGSMGERGPQGNQGVQGPIGPQGVKGDPGQSFHVEGVVLDRYSLPEPTQSIRAGAYLVGSDEPYELYIITGGHNEGDELVWTNVGNLGNIAAGPEGPIGPQGETGKDGTSIYSTVMDYVIQEVPNTTIIIIDWATNVLTNTLKENDLILDAAGRLYIVKDTPGPQNCRVYWTGNTITGPQGPEGPAGISFIYYRLNVMGTYAGYYAPAPPLDNGLKRIEIAKLEVINKQYDGSGNTFDIPGNYPLNQTYVLWEDGVTKNVTIPYDPAFNSQEAYLQWDSSYAPNQINFQDFGPGYYDTGYTIKSIILKLIY